MIDDELKKILDDIKFVDKISDTIRFVDPIRKKVAQSFFLWDLKTQQSQML